jgi:hypothetical protein
MRYPSSERRYHTRLGWWIMTHDVGGGAALAGLACVVLLADGAYLALRWGGLGGGFHRGVVLGVLTMPALAVAVRAAGVRKPAGDRRSARRRARRVNGIAVASIVAVVLFAPALGHNALLGTVLGEVAAIALWFVAFTVWWLARMRE